MISSICSELEGICSHLSSRSIAGTLANASVASDIDLADSIPRRPVVLHANAIIVSNYSRVQHVLPTRGRRAERGEMTWTVCLLTD
jgi:hypothetical protein